MPQGVVIAVKPSLLTDYEWIEPLVAFLRDNNRVNLKIGVVETCDTEGDASLTEGQKLMFIMPVRDYPTGIETGTDCNTKGATKVKFKTKHDPFTYIYEIKL